MIPKLSLGGKMAPPPPQNDDDHDGDNGDHYPLPTSNGDDNFVPATSRQEATSGGPPRGMPMMKMGGLNLSGLGRSDPESTATPRLATGAHSHRHHHHHQQNDDSDKSPPSVGASPRPVSSTPRVGIVTRASSAYTATATPRFLNGTIGGGNESSDGGDQSLNATSVSSRHGGGGGGGRAPTQEPTYLEAPVTTSASSSTAHHHHHHHSSHQNGTTDVGDDSFVEEAHHMPQEDLRGALVAARKTVVQWESQYAEIVGHYRGIVADQAERFEAALIKMEASHKEALKAAASQPTPTTTTAVPRRSTVPVSTAKPSSTDPRMRALRTSPSPSARRGMSPTTSTSRVGGGGTSVPSTGRRHVDPLSSSRPGSATSRQSSSGRAGSGDAISNRPRFSAAGGSSSLSSSRRAPGESAAPLATGRRGSNPVATPSTGRRTPTLMGSIRSNNSSETGVASGGHTTARRGVMSGGTSFSMRPATPSMVQRRNVSPSASMNTSRAVSGSSRHPIIATARSSSKDRAPATSRTGLNTHRSDDLRTSTPQMRKVMIPSTLTSAPYGSVGGRALLNSHGSSGGGDNSPRTTRRLGASAASSSHVAAPYQSRGTGAPGYPAVEPHLVLRRSATPAN